MIPTLQLKSNIKARVLQGHPWVFAAEVQNLLPETFKGEGVALRDAKGRFLGMGIYNQDSQIIWRRFSYDQVDLDEDFLAHALKQSIDRRGCISVGRLVWSEVDYLPGLIVDRFQHILVLQAQTDAMDKRVDELACTLKRLLPDIEDVVIRNDAPSRLHEGLPLVSRTLSGQTVAPQWYTIDGIDYFLDLEKGQKTGFYLDQRQEHQRIAQWCAGKTVLDGFCNQGAFGLQAAQHGAKKVLSIDSSATCIEMVKKNAQKNQYLAIQAQVDNMFDYLSGEHDTAFDVIVLDPPSFARNKQALSGALRGYKELNLRAIKRLKPGGILATYVCSHAISLSMLQEVVAQAAADNRACLRLLASTGQPLDHPVLITFPESAYLKGLVLQKY